MAITESLGVFKEKNARILLFSQLLSQICDKTMSIGLIWLITQKFSEIYLPWYLFLGFLPNLISFPWMGQWITKIRPLRTVIGADLFRGIVFLLLHVYASTRQEHELLPALFIGVFFIGIGSSFFNPALMSLPPQLVSDKNISSLNTLIDLCFSLSHVFAATLSIWLLQYSSVSNLMLINALLFMFGAFYQSRIEPQTNTSLVANPQTTPDFASKEEIQSENFATSMKKTFQILKQFSVIKKLIYLFFILNIIMAPLFIFLPWYAKNVFGGSSSALSWLETGWAFGALTGGIALLVFQIRNHKHFLNFLYTLISGFGLIFICFAYNQKIHFGVSLMFALGLILSILNVNILTYFQKELSEDQLPYIMTLANLIATASVPFSMLSAGFIMRHISVPQFAFYSGAIVILFSLFFRKISSQDHFTTKARAL